MTGPVESSSSAIWGIDGIKELETNTVQWSVQNEETFRQDKCLRGSKPAQHTTATMDFFFDVEKRSYTALCPRRSSSNGVSSKDMVRVTQEKLIVNLRECHSWSQGRSNICAGSASKCIAPEIMKNWNLSAYGNHMFSSSVEVTAKY